MNSAATPSAAFRWNDVPRWAWALGFMLLLMVGANLAMVKLSALTRHDLVRPDYYQASLDQDGAIARAARAAEAGMGITFARAGGDLQVEAASASLREATCAVLFYRPDDGREDRRIELGRAAAPDPQGRLVWKAPAPALRSGYWVVRLEWKKAGAITVEKTLRWFVPG